MPEIIEKIVDFRYCTRCTHQSTDDSDSPCHECLNEPARWDGSRKPLYFEDDGSPVTPFTED